MHRALLPACLIFVGSISTSAQLPRRLERCLPYPTLAEEVRDMQPVQATKGVRIAAVEFAPADKTPYDLRAAISNELETRTFSVSKSDSGWTDLSNEIAETVVRGTLQNHGYIRLASPDLRLKVLRTAADHDDVAASIRVDPGPQYLLGTLSIQSAEPQKTMVISPAALRRLVPISTGDLFNVGTIRAALKNITRAYAAKGYIDMTSEPDFEFHDESKTIDLTLKVDEQVQYRVGRYEIWGFDAATREKLLKTLQQPGEVFDIRAVDRFFTTNRTVLPSDASRDDVTIQRDPRTRTVHVSIDLRSCPGDSRR